MTVLIHLATIIVVVVLSGCAGGLEGRSMIRIVKITKRSYEISRHDS